MNDLSDKFGGLDDSVISYLDNTERGQASMDGLSKSIANSSAEMSSATIKAELLSKAMNTLTNIAATLIIKFVAWGLDELIVTLDEQKEKLEESITAYENSKEELQNINDELKTTAERIDELNGKDNLTFTEQDELENLIKTNEELERKIFLLEQANKEAEKEVVAEAQKTYDKTINNRTMGAVDQIDFYTNSSLLEGVNWDNFKNDLPWLVAQYQKQEALLSEAQVNGWSDIEDQARNNLTLLEGYMAEASQDYQTLYDQIGGISDYSMTEDLKVAKQDLNDILDIAANILGYSGQRSTTILNNIFSTDGIEKTKEELLQLAKSGELTPETIKGYTNLNKALEETTLSAEDLCNELYAESGTKSLQELIDIFGQDAVEKLTPEDLQIALTISTEEADKAIDEEKKKYEKLKAEFENTGLQDVVDDYDDAVKSSKEYVNSLDDIYKSYNGINNIDRDILYWNDETLENNRQFLEEMYGSYEDAVADLKGTWSTVLGTSENIDGVEIAYTQMLQTDHGLVPFTEDTFWSYFDSIFSQSWNEDGTFNAEKFIQLDAQGTDMLINGQMEHVANMIAAAEGQYMNGIKLTADDVIAIGTPGYDDDGNDILPGNNSPFKGYSVHDVQAWSLQADYQLARVEEKAKETGNTVEGIWAKKDAIDDYADYGDIALQGLIKSKQQLEKDNETTIFSNFDDSLIGERLQHITKLFNEGKITHKEYFDALQNEIENVDFSNYTNSLEDANKASQQFFTDSVQQVSNGLSSLINSFDTDEISVSEYLDGYLSIAGTIDTLTDNLQENSSKWDQNGEAISDATNKVLDGTQDNLRTAVNVIEEFQDSTYALEQIMSGSIEKTSDDFQAYTNLIATDLAAIVNSGGEMAEEISDYMGTTTNEIANALLTDTSNFSIAEQAIATNTNTAIQSMAQAIATLLDNLGNAISNFKVDISFGMANNSASLFDAIRGKGDLKFELGASGKSLSTIGKAVSSFGKSISTNISQQLVKSEDYHRGTKVGNSNYTPNSNVLKNYEKALDNVKDSSKSAADSSKEEFEEVFDFFDRRVTVLNDAISLLQANLENVNGSFAKNQLIDAQSSIYQEEIKNYTDALNMYQQKANEVLATLPDDIAEKIKNGSISLTTFMGESSEAVVDAMKDYEGWSDKIADCNQKLAELKESLRDLELEKFNNIIEGFTQQFDLRQTGIDNIDKQIAVFEEAGMLVGKSFYQAQKEQASKQLDILKKQQMAMANQLSSALSSGNIETGTDEWLEMVSELQNVEGSILDCEKAIEEFDNAILDLHWQVFERIQDQFSNLDSELDNLIGLLDDIDVADTSGNWTTDSITKLGLLSQQYELAQHNVAEYNKAIEELKEQYANGEYSAIEYTDKLAELSDGMWENANAVEAVKDAIMDLHEARVDKEIEGIEEEIEAYNELIQAKIDELDAEKELNDYRNSISQKSKSITDLERQIAAMSNDTTSATIAQRKKLEEQLAEAKKELEDAEYDHSIQSQKDALNKQFEDYEKTRNEEIEALKDSLNNQEKLIAESFKTVKQNASTIGQQISNIAKQHGVQVSNTLTSSWQAGENAIAAYGTVLSAQSSAFIDNIIGVENEVWDLQAQADNTANSLAWMFSTQADNLVNELIESANTEWNLQNMTNALQSSLVNALERGYDISGITTALKGIESAANSAGSAIDKLFDKQNAVSGYTYQNAVSGYTYQNAVSGYTYQNAVSGYTYQSAGSSYGSNVVRVYDSNGKLVTITTKKDAEKKYGATLKKYAKGTRNSKGNLIVKDEQGYELVLPKLASGKYAIENEGSQILTKVETDNIFDWAKFNPDMFIPNFANNFATSIPHIASKNVNNVAPSVNVGNLITVQGNVDSSNIKQMEIIANKAVNNLVDKMYNGKKYGSY